MNRSITIARRAFLASLSLLVACGGPSGNTGGNTPATGYTVGGTVSGLNGTGLVLQDNGSDNLNVSANGGFTFATPVAGQGSYAVTVLTQPSGPAQTCTVTNGSGTIAAANVTNVAVACSSASKAWGTAALVETNNAGAAQSPQIAIGGNGSVFAVWAQYDGAGAGFGASASIWVNRYVSGSGWSGAQLLRAGGSGNPASSPQIAADANGNAMAIWQEFDAGTIGNTNITSIWASLYTAGTGWSTPVTIDTATERASAPQVGFDGSGNAIAAWNQDNYGIHQVWANRYVAGTGWGTPVRIDGSGSSAFPPDLAVTVNGDALVVWVQSSAGNLWTNRYVAGTGWGTPAQFTNDGLGNPSSIVTNAQTPQIAINANGTAFALWREDDGAFVKIRSKHFSSVSGWDAANELIDSAVSDATHDLRDPQLAVDASGSVHAVWAWYDGAHYHIRTAKRPAATTWGTTVPLDSDTGSAGLPQVAVNTGGDAFAVWYQSDGTRFNIWSNRRLAADTLWGTAELIETDNSGSAYDPQIVVDTSGNATSVWRQNDGTRDNIVGNRYQ